MYYIINENNEILAITQSLGIALLIQKKLVESLNYKQIGIMEV